VSTITLPVEGACMCGRVRMRVSAPPIMSMACHCTGCQKMSASAFSLTALVPAEAFALLEGETQIGALHGPSAYVHCAHCLNWLYTAPAGMPFVNIRPGLFDAPAWSTPFAETCVGEKLPWATTGAKYSFDKFPPPDRYEPLMREYASWNGGGT
jgi:hypothetical protein